MPVTSEIENKVHVRLKDFVRMYMCIYLRWTSAPINPLSGKRDAIASNSSSCFSAASAGFSWTSFDEFSAAIMSERKWTEWKW